MKKIHGKRIIATMCCLMTVPVVASIAACKKDPVDGPKTYNTETRPVTVAIGAVDRNFNPFFFTAQNDGEVISPTQIQMITADENGDVACGQDEATVALAYKYTMYDADGHVTQQGSTDGSTVYEFVIKNGIKFSDGVDLTIKDVLFNLYTYLDPMYSGSSTIYSTKIKGLAAYRSQQPNMSDGASDSYLAKFEGVATTRINALKAYDDGRTLNTSAITPQVEKDLITVGTLFREELTTDWTNNVGNLDSYTEYRFTEDWEVYMFNEGYITYQYDANGVRRKDENGKYLTTLDGDQSNIRDSIEDAAKGLTGTEREEAIKNEAIDIVYEEYLIDEKNADGTLAQVRSRTANKLYRVITEWATATTIRQEFIEEAMSDEYKNSTQNGLAVKSISGIETYRTSTFDGALSGDALDPNQTYDVLKITINGVDPAAIWQFGFTVAPMHYYSGTLDDYDYVAECDPNNEEKSNRFGVAFANKTFFDTVLNANAKVQKPVGAGPYMVTGSQVYVNEQATYERNPNFYTVGTGLHNATIKTLQYRTISTDSLVNTLITGNVDFGSPNCTPQIITQLTGSGLKQIQYNANGFGYVGINPKFIPNVYIRQAIMKAMNVTSITTGYYTQNYASVIYRPISTTSWVYTESNEAERKQYFGEIPEIAYAGDGDYVDSKGARRNEYEDLLTLARCTKQGGLWYTADGQPLKYTFTIAGDSVDHPAWDMFKNAEDILERIGMDITVKNDIQALPKLAQGQLAVWAAAWTSGIDPDMYQVYHKDSKATSVKNWGYDVILQDTTDKYSSEQATIEKLSKLIEDGRSVLNRDTRRKIYYQALDKVMELAVELPTYQRKELVVYNGVVLKETSLNTDANANTGVLDRIWELDYN